MKNKSKKNKRDTFEKSNVLSPLLRTVNNLNDNEERISDDDDDEETEFDRSNSKSCFLFLISCGRKCFKQRRGYDFEDEFDDNGEKKEDASLKLRQFSVRLDGVNRMLNEKIDEVQNNLRELSDRRNQFADQILRGNRKDTANNIVKIDLLSIMKEIHVYSRQYEFFNNIKVNLIKLRANTDVHAFSDTVKDALSLIPSNMRRIKSEKEFSLATRYSDALEDFANRMELPLNTVELQKIELDESYDSQIEDLLQEREALRSSKSSTVSISNPRTKIEPSVSTPSRRIPVLLN